MLHNGLYKANQIHLSLRAAKQVDNGIENLGTDGVFKSSDI